MLETAWRVPLAGSGGAGTPSRRGANHRQRRREPKRDFGAIAGMATILGR
jgi:hypothetical protein